MFSDPATNLEQFHIDPGMTVADLGSGTGFYTFILSEKVGPGGKVYSVDVQKDLLNKLKTEAENRGLHNVEIIWGDLDELKGTTLRDFSVDRAVVVNTLFQLEKPESFVAEAKRILNPKSGKILVIDWTDSFGGIGPSPDVVIRPDVARTMFENAGFKFDRDIKVGDHHYGMIFRTS
ncbi:MAG TPA: methyltransferase domain-containing protein [Candidatus Paceibacterota bacterium]|nr:methyltransferase domain-containing protein [Candidatus Paceibacterota bacterium]HRZ34595.1 methyltransferase domain-containing protein [Candidatus Paceibacterota bacterium]